MAYRPGSQLVSAEASHFRPKECKITSVLEGIVEQAGSVTRWLIQVRDGTSEATNALWERYFQRLAGVVRAQLGNTRLAVVDESDVALSAFHSFFRGVNEGRFVDLQGRDQLWRVLVVIAKRKAISWMRHEHAQRRGGGQVHENSLLNDIVGTEPTPELAATILDELYHLLELLHAEDAMLALIATRKCEGFSNQEIAAELTVAVRTIERKLQRTDILLREDIQRRFGEEKYVKQSNQPR